ncbi:hypothetical protein EON65_09260 [archaeon]|nr:MAG: hypothetical protein EON65_09260 [archaeon]
MATQESSRHRLRLEVPALGVSEEGSTEGTMEGIYRMFNITVGEANGENGGENLTWPQREEVLVQIDCLILNAKLLVRSTSQ